MAESAANQSVVDPTIYQQVTQDDGKVFFVPYQPPGGTVSKVVGYVQARAVETNTHLGLIGGALSSSVVSESVKAALPALLAGDYAGALQAAMPALLALFGVVGAVLTPERRAAS